MRSLPIREPRSALDVATAMAPPRSLPDDHAPPRRVTARGNVRSRWFALARPGDRFLGRLVDVPEHLLHRLVAVEGLLELLAREVVHAVEALDELPRPCGRGLLDEV